MNAEALIGTVLGTCTLQKLIGQGGMGAVFLAQQSRPRRQVAVKVLLPITSLTPNQLAAFLERFRRETDAAASMEHPNIMPVHEYGERGGLAYLVMPYVSGGTLRDELERSGSLPLETIANYLEQIAAAIDFAHEHHVIHRDIKPANIILTPEGRLLLADFGLVKIVADEGQISQIHITGAGAPVGTPDYMSPEQVIGEEVDVRADLYSLGVILYQMVTGTTPFRGETPMQIAAKHLQVPPPSAQILRPDLPIGADQVLQRALAKRPADRYGSAQNLANAFRTALIKAGIQLNASYYTNGLLSGSTGGRFAVPKGQFDPMRQTISTPKVSKPAPTLHKTDLQPTTRKETAVPTQPTPNPEAARRPGGLPSRTGKFPVGNTSAYSSDQPDALQGEGGGGLLSRTGKFPMVGTGTMPAVQPRALKIPGGGLLSSTGKFPVGDAKSLPKPGMTGAATTAAALAAQDTEQYTRSTEGNLSEQGEQVVLEGTSTMKLNGPAKVVQIPVAGQPGEFVTGLLPLRPAETDPVATPPTRNSNLTPRMKIVLLVAAVLLIAAGLVGLLWFIHQAPAQNKTKSTHPASGTAAALPANGLFSDPLDQNTNQWTTDPADRFAFKDGAYHITSRDNNTGSAAILQNHTFDGHITYSLTMEEINGDDTNSANSFGMIFYLTQQNKTNSKNQHILTFYTFEVLNNQNSEYQFWSYNNTDPDHPWKDINNGHLKFGNEFHQGKGPLATNTFSIEMNAGVFTVTVNGTKLNQTFQDSTLSTGMVGMLVNQKDTEVAFTNLKVTKD